MTYVSQQDLINRFGERELVELSDRAEPPAGVIDADVIARAIADAEAMIDSYIRVRYTLPLASVPSRLAKIACDIARFHLYHVEPSEQVRKAYEDATAQLKDISAGRAQLDVAGAEPASGESSDIAVSGPDRVFSDSTMKGF